MELSRRDQRTAVRGERMIEVKVRFWTDRIADYEGDVVPKHAWTAGVVQMERNKTHGILPENPIPFNSLLDLGAAIERTLIAHGIRLLPSRRMQRYGADDAGE